MSELTEVQVNPDLVEEQVAPAPALDQMKDNEVRRRARLNRPRWVPGRWHPVYEEIVLLSVMGYSNITIAEMKGFTKEHISNVINTPQARLIIDLTLKQMEKKRVLSIDQRIEKITNRAMDRLEEVIENDAYAVKNPGGMFDRALSMLKVSGKVKEPVADLNVHHKLSVPAGMMEKLRKGIEASDRALALHSGTPDTPETIVESPEVEEEDEEPSIRASA